MLHWLACVCTLDLSCIGLSFVRTLPPPTGVLAKLKMLSLTCTLVADAGCAALAAALDSGALPVLEGLYLHDIPASDAAKDSVGKRIELKDLMARFPTE